jgi:uncharacterized protein YndB with AHSA1/START domain
MRRPTPTDRASRILEITRVIEAPRSRVFQAFVDPALLASWWGPDGFHTPVEGVVVEARAGGLHRKTMVLDDERIAAGMGVTVGAKFPDAAEILEIVPPELLVLTSEPQPEAGLVERTITRIEVHEEGPNRTRIALVDGPYTDTMAPFAETGWIQSLVKLERTFAG